MTSINGTPGYAAIYLSPPVMADFTAGSSSIRFDVSTFVSSARDWLDVSSRPFADAMSYPFRSDLDVDGSGLPRNGIHVVHGRRKPDGWNRPDPQQRRRQQLGEAVRFRTTGIGGLSRMTRTPVRDRHAPDVDHAELSDGAGPA